MHEVHDLIKGINLNKSTTGVPKKCIELASDHISECLTFIFIFGPLTDHDFLLETFITKSAYYLQYI